MRRAVLVLVLALAVVVVVVAIAGRDDETDEAASSCTSTLVAANAGTDADPDLILYQGTSSRPLTPPSSNSIDRRTRLGDDRIYAYGFFGLDAAPCGPER